MTNTARILAIASALLLLNTLARNVYAEGTYQELQDLRAKERAIDKQLDQEVEKQLGPEDQYRGRADDYEDDVEDAIEENPKLLAMQKERDRLFHEAVEFKEKMKFQERIDNLVYDLGSGNKTKKNLTPEEWDMLRGERHMLTKNQESALDDAGVNPWAPVPTADGLVKNLNRDIKEWMDKRGLGHKEPVKDEIQEDLFQAVDAFVGGINAVMRAGEPSMGSSTPAVDAASMQSGMRDAQSMSQSMPTSMPMGGGEGHYHGPSGRDR